MALRISAIFAKHLQGLTRRAAIPLRSESDYNIAMSFAHPFDFDPTYGYDLDRLLAVQPPAAPDDFDSFWRDTYAETLAVPLQLEREPLNESPPGYRVSVVRYDGFGGFRLGAWLVEPNDARAVTRYVVYGHGYYNRPIEHIAYAPDAVVLNIASRGLGLSRGGGISNQTAFHVLHGIESRETYVHRGCAADVWSGTSALLHLFPRAAGRLEYAGPSFGGGIGAMAVPWDARLRFAELDVPSFGNHPLRATLPCAGSGEAVRRKLARHPEVLDVLHYFDSAIHATRIAIPTHVSCAAFDPAVPPPGQFCVYNAIAAPKCLHVRPASHFEYPGAADDEAKRQRSIRAFRESIGIA